MLPLSHLEVINMYVTCERSGLPLEEFAIFFIIYLRCIIFLHDKSISIILRSNVIYCKHAWISMEAIHERFHDRFHSLTG